MPRLRKEARHDKLPDIIPTAPCPWAPASSCPLITWTVTARETVPQEHTSLTPIKRKSKAGGGGACL